MGQQKVSGFRHGITAVCSWLLVGSGQLPFLHKQANRNALLNLKRPGLGSTSTFLSESVFLFIHDI